MDSKGTIRNMNVIGMIEESAAGHKVPPYFSLHMPPVARQGEGPN